MPDRQIIISNHYDYYIKCNFGCFQFDLLIFMMRSLHSRLQSTVSHFVWGHSPTVMSVVKAILFALPRNHENHIDKYEENK